MWPPKKNAVKYTIDLVQVAKCILPLIINN